ncbi:MAG: hypothetical protein ACRDS9_16295 [Pseudonocardiaceae bacterium]
MRQRTMAVSVAVVALTVGVVVAGTSATTRALFSDTVSGADSRVGTATVELGDGAGTIELGYTELRPGRAQVVDLTISYQGTVPADVTLEIAPSGESALCVQRKGRWKSRPGGAVTVKIGSANPVSYCDLLNGRSLLLASAVPPGSERHIDVAVMLSKDANSNMRGLAERDVATVRARGGFTDHAVGTISITTVGHEKDKDGDRRDKLTGDDMARKADTTSSAVPESLPDHPTSGALSALPPVTLPAECEQAGMRFDSFEDVIVLDQGRHPWNALEQRGKGAGPFLIVGTDGDDEIVGSAGADCIVGGGGRDRLAGDAGDDVLIGDAEADLLDGGLGNDLLLGGSDIDDLRGGGGIDQFDGGSDGASCDAGHDAAGAIRCQAADPPLSSTSPSSGKDGEAPSPTTTSPPSTTSAPPTTSPPTPTTAAPASAGAAAPPSPTAQAGPPSDGTVYASVPAGVGEDSTQPVIGSRVGE